MAWLLLAMLLSFTHLTGGDVRLEGWEPFWARVAGTAYRTLCLGGWPIWMLLFGLYFPKPLQLELLRPWLKWILIAPLAASAMMDSYVSVRSSEDWRGVEGMIAATRALGRWRMVMVFLSVGAFFASLSRKWASASQPDVRRRLRLLVTGTSLGMAHPRSAVNLVGSERIGAYQFCQISPNVRSCLHGWAHFKQLNTQTTLRCLPCSFATS